MQKSRLCANTTEGGKFEFDHFGFCVFMGKVYIFYEVMLCHMNKILLDRGFCMISWIVMYYNVAARFVELGFYDQPAGVLADDFKRLCRMEFFPAFT